MKNELTVKALNVAVQEQPIETMQTISGDAVFNLISQYYKLWTYIVYSYF